MMNLLNQDQVNVIINGILSNQSVGDKDKTRLNLNRQILEATNGPKQAIKEITATRAKPVRMCSLGSQ